MNSSDSQPTRACWLNQIVLQYESRLLAYAARLLGGDQDAAQDVVQETLLRLCRADMQQTKPKIPAWLFAVCRTRVIDMRRTQHAAEGDVERMAVDHEDPAAQAASADDQRQVARLVTTLSPRQQELLHLRMHAGLSYKEIAEATGMTVTNVGFQLHSAIRALRERVQNQQNNPQARPATL